VLEQGILATAGLGLHRGLSIVLGTLSACAGAFVMFVYALPATEDLFPPIAGVVVYSQASLSDRILGALITWGLAAGALYMAFRLIRPPSTSRTGLRTSFK
jgi:hypothetical protein